MKQLLLAGVALAFVSAPVAARDLTIDDVISLSRVGAPAVSADGHWLVWQQRETDLDGNKGRYDLWKLDLASYGAKPEKLVAEADVNETAPQFSADGKTVYYTADKGGDDAVWSVPIAGGTPVQLTQLKGGISGFKVAPTGDKLLIWADRKPGAPSLEPAMVKKDARAGTGRVFDKLFIRHWDTWSTGNRSQLFVLPLTASGAAGYGVAIEHGLDGDTPSKPFGGGEEVNWSADGKTVYFALRVAGRTEELSTNLDIFAAPADGSAAPVDLTADNKGTDTLPTVSPDGKWLAYVSMARAGYESDRQVLKLRNLATGETRALTQNWDRSVASITWSVDSKRIFVTAEDVQETPVFDVDLASGKIRKLLIDGPDGTVGTVAAVLALRNTLIIQRNSLTSPDDFFRNGMAHEGEPFAGLPTAQLTQVNAAKLADIRWPSVTKFSFAGANNDTVWGYVAKPGGLADGAKAPIAFIVHGGPQGSMNNAWSYRWNPALFTGAGYAVVTVDFHGSTGYGQSFQDAINKNWGGWPLEDLQKGLAAATGKFTFLDGNNACALGASYGGYMMNWIEGNWPDRFKCIVQHDGVFDARAMAYETEELWFDEWEHGGHPYYEDPAAYEKWNPVNLVTKWKTPMLVVTSERDFRIPYTQGIAAFTALQRREIPSRLLTFPDESHWVQKPRNSRQWYHEVLGWLGQWTGKTGN